MTVDVLVGGDSRRDELVADLTDRRGLKVCAGGRGDGEVRVGLHLAQSRFPQQAREFAAVGKVGAALGEQLAETVPQPVRELLLGAVLIGAEQRLQRGVGVLDEKPPAGPQCLDHRPQRPLPVRHMNRREPCVREVEALRRFLGAHVVHPDLDRRAGRGVRPRRVDVGRDDPPGRGRPSWRARTPRTCRPRRPPAAPAGTDAEALDVPEGGGVEESGEGVEALPASVCRLSRR